MACWHRCRCGACRVCRWKRGGGLRWGGGLRGPSAALRFAQDDRSGVGREISRRGLAVGVTNDLRANANLGRNGVDLLRHFFLKTREMRRRA
jgi:hypothetical protein